jgi:hypothetical protein
VVAAVTFVWNGQIVGEQCREFGLEARDHAQDQEIGHQAAGRFLREFFEQPVAGRTIGIAGEQLVAVDEIEQRHGLAPQGLDHPAIANDVGALVAGWARPACKVAPMNTSGRSSYYRTSKITPLKAEEPSEAGPLAQAAYDLVPQIKIMDLLLGVAAAPKRLATSMLVTATSGVAFYTRFPTSSTRKVCRVPSITPKPANC